MYFKIYNNLSALPSNYLPGDKPTNPHTQTDRTDYNTLRR